MKRLLLGLAFVLLAAQVHAVPLRSLGNLTPTNPEVPSPKFSGTYSQMLSEPATLLQGGDTWDTTDTQAEYIWNLPAQTWVFSLSIAVTPTPTITLSPTITPTFTNTPTGSWTPLNTNTPTNTATFTPTGSITPTPTNTIVSNALILGPGSFSQQIGVWAPISAMQAPFNAVGNGIADDTAAIQAAINYAASQPWGVVTIPSGKQIAISSTLIVPYNVDLNWPGVTVIPIPGGTFLNNYIFYLGTDSTHYPHWTVSYADLSGRITGMTIDNTVHSILPLYGFYVANSFILENFQVKYLTASVIRDNVDYIDNFRVDKMIDSVIPANAATVYQVQVGNVGDGLYLNQLNFYQNGNSLNAVFISQCNGGKINNCIGGTYEVYASRGLVIEGLHTETGQVINSGSDLTLMNSFFYDKVLPGCVCQTFITGGPTNHFSQTLINVAFMHFLDWNSINPGDVQTDGNGIIKLTNSYSDQSMVSALGDNQHHGVSIIDNTGAPVTNFDNYSYFYSQDSVLNGKNMESNLCVNTVPPNTAFLSSVGNNGGPATWGLTTGTYYYQAQSLYDPIRLVGTNNTNGEKNATLTNGSNGALISISSADNPYIFRLYRGTSSGSYNEYVDVHNCRVSAVYDDGLDVDGFAWISRTAAGVTAIYTTAQQITRGTLLESVLGTTAPVTGSWQVGDTLMSVPSSGTTELFGCSVGGNPPTFLSNGITWR